MKRLNSPSLLHPPFAERLHVFALHLQAEDGRFQVFETVRPPERQHELFAIGRDPAQPGYGKHVTDAQAYQSAHQFGLAADIWPCVNGEWQWWRADDPRWEPLIRLAPQFGLECLSWERPHVQMEGFDWRHLAAGPMDTPGWLAWLEQRNKETT